MTAVCQCAGFSLEKPSILLILQDSQSAQALLLHFVFLISTLHIPSGASPLFTEEGLALHERDS